MSWFKGSVVKILGCYGFALRRKGSAQFREEEYVGKVFEAVGYELFRTNTRVLWFNIGTLRKHYDEKGSVAVIGHGSSGSSAIYDYLKEFRGNMPANQTEFRLLKERGGLLDLEAAWRNWSHWNSESAIDDFLYVVKMGFRPCKYKMLGNFKIVGLSKQKKRVPPAVYRFTNNITLLDFNGHWIVDKSESLSKQLKKLCLFKLGKLRFTVIDPKADFTSYGKLLLKELREETLSDNNYKYAIYDQLVDPCNIPKCEKYFDDLKTIIVIRDPRDQYISFKRTEQGFTPDTVEGFCKLYKANMETINKTENTIVVRYENFVVNHEYESRRLIDFLGLDEGDHLLKGRYFKRQESIKRIKKWKAYNGSKSMDFIAKTIPEYCYGDSYEI